MAHLKLLISLLIFMTCVNTIHSQEKDKPYNVIEVSVDFDTVYDKTINHLQNDGYFILALDRLSGFIQAKVYTPDKNIISDKMGDRKIFNFLIRPTQNGSTNISLAIFLERSYRNPVDGGFVYYDRDMGIIKEEELYAGVLQFLKETLEP